MPCYHPPLTREEEAIEKLDLVTNLLCKACEIIESVDGMRHHEELNSWWKEHQKHDAKIEYLLAKVRYSGVSSLTEEELEDYGFHISK